MAKHHENIHEPERYESEKETEASTMANICHELIERIFDLLDVDSLLNVAGTCKRLQVVAATKFGHKYGNKHIWFFENDFLLGSNRAPGVYLNRDQIDVIGLKCGFRFLRCFGAKLSNLEDPFSYIRNDHFHRYVNQYCADTLINITSNCEGAFPFESCSKPFANVKKIQISDAELGYRLEDFMNLFPNLRHLEMTDIKIHETAIAVRVPRMEHLALNVRMVFDDDDVIDEFTTKNVPNFLRENRYLQSLDLFSYNKIGFTELLNMINENPFLLKLRLKCGSSAVVNADQLKRFTNEHPLIEELYLPVCRFSADYAFQLIRQLNSLRQFEFDFTSCHERDRFLNHIDKKWQYDLSGWNVITLTVNR